MHDAQPALTTALTAPCFLAPSSTGLIPSLAPSTPLPERQLLEWLLLQGRPCPLHWPTLERALALPRTAIAHCLLALLRTEALTMQSLCDTQDYWMPLDGLSQLSAELQSWAKVGQHILLATHDGLTLASVGWTAYESAQLAASLGPLPDGVQQQALQLGHLPLRLLWTDALDSQHPALLRWTLRLLQPQAQWLLRTADTPHAHTSTAASDLR